MHSLYCMTPPVAGGHGSWASEALIADAMQTCQLKTTIYIHAFCKPNTCQAYCNLVAQQHNKELVCLIKIRAILCNQRKRHLFELSIAHCDAH